MAENSNENPLKGPPPSEVPLSEAPLIRVVAQVRFPPVLSVANGEFIAPFQEAIRDAYPTLRPDQSQRVVFGPGGPIETRTDTIWRFFDKSESWSVTLAPDFMALQTSDYESRDDFFQRLSIVLEALRAHIRTDKIDRLGVRYIDRMPVCNPADLTSLVRPEVTGVLGTALAESAEHALTENVFRLPEDHGKVRTRWGLLPPRSTVDPAAVEPIDEVSWLLDLDAFSEETVGFDVEDTVQRARMFAERIYSIFRWVVTEQFLLKFGGQLDG